MCRCLCSLTLLPRGGLMYSVAFLAVVCSWHLFRVRKSLLYVFKTKLYPVWVLSSGYPLASNYLNQLTLRAVNCRQQAPGPVRCTCLSADWPVPCHSQRGVQPALTLSAPIGPRHESSTVPCPMPPNAVAFN